LSYFSLGIVIGSLLGLFFPAKTTTANQGPTAPRIRATASTDFIRKGFVGRSTGALIWIKRR
jgi:hypothetical protein